MKNESLYNKTVDILVQAYFNDTLKHGNCAACAVGNLVCENMNYDKANWFAPIDAFMPSWYDCIALCVNVGCYKGVAKQEIDSTGYSLNEVFNIEKAFEGACEGDSDEDYMFNGLMAVIDVLDEIHENKDSSVTKISKNKFTKTQLQKI